MMALTLLCTEHPALPVTADRAAGRAAAWEADRRHVFIPVPPPHWEHRILRTATRAGLGYITFMMILTVRCRNTRNV